MKNSDFEEGTMKHLLWIVGMFVASSAWAADLPEADAPGARLYAEKCSICHALPHPKRLDWPHWRHMLGVMRQRMHERDVPEPTKDEWRQIAAYLKAHAR